MSTRTIDCEQALRILAAYLDGELETREEGDLESHLDRCRSCYSRAEFERRLKEQLRGLKAEPEPRPALEARIRGLLHDFAAGD